MSVVKAVIWDLDETLWHGTLAEGDDVRPFPEALDLIRRLDRAGVVQSVASKNDPDDASARLAAHGLLDVFVHPRISWSAKSASVAEIIALLDIGADAVVLLDDSSFERAEVIAGVPGVRACTVDEFVGQDETRELLERHVTREAANRPSAYRTESRRRAAEAAFVGTPAEFLASLGMVLTVRSASIDDLDRAAELTERTHQLNTTGRTFTASELADRMISSTDRVLVADLVDRFGDYGTIGLCLLGRGDDHWLIELLLMSCRVMNRNVGNALIAAVARLAEADGVALRAGYVPNGRNRQMQITYALSGFTRIDRVDRAGATVVYGHAEPARIRTPSAVELVFGGDLVGAARARG